MRVFMLTLNVNLEDCALPATAGGRRVELGDSFVEAYESPYLRLEWTTANKEMMIWVGEAEDPASRDSKRGSQISRYSSCDNVEGAAIRVGQIAGDEVLEIQRTSCGTSPLYVSVAGSSIFASWRYEWVVQHIRSPKPNLEACRIFIEHGAGRVRDQVIAGTYMLWPGEGLTFSKSGLTFNSAPEVSTPAPTPVRDDAHVCAAFDELLRLEFSKYRISAAQPLVELSGGLDSSTLALAAGPQFPGAASYGLIQEGVMGKQQKRRRREVIELALLDDFEYPANKHPPFKGLAQLQECAVCVFDDNHRPSCVAAIDSHPSNPFNLLVSGIGGDELMMEDTYTRAEWEVPGNVCRSSVVAAAARADMFLRRGIWPISPFCSPPIVDFCRALPKEFRVGRLLIKLHLARLGMSDGFILPRYQEHYGHTMRHEMAMIDFDELFSDSLVASYQIVGLSKLLEDARDAHYGGFSFGLMGKLWSVAKLDRVLANYLT